MEDDLGQCEVGPSVLLWNGRRGGGGLGGFGFGAWTCVYFGIGGVMKIDAAEL